MKKTILLVIVFLAVASTLFYWYEYRPAEARKTCHDRYWADSENAIYDIEFSHCLTGFGLAPINN